MKLSDITFCIKTIHRPWSCNRLVRSILDQIDRDANIIVVDDGKPENRFTANYPNSAASCKVIHPAAFDVGVGVGRNLAVDSVATPYFMLFDDDHVVNDQLRFDRLLDRFSKLDVDLLAVRQSDGGKPMLLEPIPGTKRLSMHHGERKRIGNVVWCDMVSNCYLAKTDKIREIRWDEQLKTYEHWEFFWRAKMAGLKVAVAVDCHIRHAHVGGPNYKVLRARSRFRRIGLRKHGFDSMRYPGGGIVRA